MSTSEAKGGVLLGNEGNDLYKSYEVDVKSSETATLPMKKTRTAFSYTFYIFVLIGMVQLIGWNALLNTIFGLLQPITATDTALDPASITALYSTLNLLGTAACTYWAGFFIRPEWTIAGLILTGINGLACGGMTHADRSTSFGLYHLLACSMGIAACITGCSAFGYANYFPYNYGGALSAGLGVAGVVTFFFWMLSKYAFFTMDFTGTRNANWFLGSVVAALSFGTTILVIRFFRQSWVKDIMRKAREEKLEAKKVQSEDMELSSDIKEAQPFIVEQETILETIKATFVLASLFFLTMFITLVCFPTVGPFAWRKTEILSDVLVGVFQIGDLIGRYAPNIFSWCLLQKRALIIATYLRLIFIVTFILSFKLYANVFFGNYAFQVIQMLLLSITNGWLISCKFIRIPQFVKSSTAKARSGTIGLFAVLLGIFLGQWVAFFIIKL